MNCLLDKERVVKYPCSPNCHLFGDCIVEFEKQLQNEDKVEKTYIEKEALRIAYEKSYQNDSHVVEGASAIHAQEHRHILSILDKQPAADVVPVKHAQWVNRTIALVDTVGSCTNCGKEAVWRSRNKPYSICPYCGAKMDLEVNNGHS